MRSYPNQDAIAVGDYGNRRRYLHTTTAVSSPAWWCGALTIGLVLASNPQAFAESGAAPIVIPLHHLKGPERLGILIGANGGSAKMYMFDTGSDQFNGQFYPKDAPENAGPKTVYAYGDGSYAYRLQPVSIKNLTYYSADGKTVAYDDQRKQVVAQIEDHIFTGNYKPLPGEELNLDKSSPIVVNGVTYYADLNARSKIAEGVSAESDNTFGTFGAGDFLMTDSANSSAIGGLTKSGYIVSANANLDNAVTPGCSPCTIVNLNENVRAQYISYIPWGTQDRTGYRPTFPGSNGNASTQFEGNYTYTFKFKVDGTVKTVTIDGPALFDTGSPSSVFLTQKGVLSKLQSEGLVLPENGEVKLDSFSIAPQGQAEQNFIFENVDVTRQAGESGGDGLILGLPFFQQNSVIYDLENKTTGYSALFVSADNFSTNPESGDQPHLGRITAQMGNSGLFGIAGVISGSGNLTLDAKTFVRLTNVNTFTGSTFVNKDANLSLAGLGSIENSAKVILDGSLDISERGNANKNWGISDSVKDARIRSLSGSSGVLTLGNQNLILTAANDAFAGSITDLDDNKHYGGGVIVAGGVQTLSGKNDYTGMTQVDKGAGLLLADTGSITHDVTTSGLFGNDGVIEGTAFTRDSGVVTGAGTFGAIAIANGGTIAPGSITDSANQIVALTVKGNFTQEAGSIYGAGLGKSSDLIDIGGSASIDTGAKVELVREGAISIDTRYNLLTAAGGVNGTYGGLTGALATDSPFVDFQLIYDANNVFLDTERSAMTFAGVAESFNQRSTATASEALGTGNAIHDSIVSLTRQESLNAFDLLSGEIHASTKSALIEESRFERDAINDRLRAAFEGVGTTAMPVLAYGEGGPVLAPATTDRLAAWGAAFGSWGSFDGDGNASSLDTSTGGFLTGFDGLVNESIRLGLMAGYSHSSFHADGRSSSASSDNYHLGLYGGTQWGAVGFRSGLAYSWHDIETSRSVIIPGFADSLSGDYDAGTFQAFGELGYRIDTTVASFEPFANLAYVNLRSDGFSESGSAAALSGHSETTETTFTTLGLRASSNLMLGTMKSVARGTLGWRHAFGDVTPGATHSFAGGEAFTVAGVPIAENSAVIEAGLDLTVTEAATVGVSYQGQFGSGVQQNGFNAKLNVRF